MGKLLLLTMLLLLFGKCKETIDKSITQATTAIDNAIIGIGDATAGLGNNIDAAAANIQSILDDLDDKIIGEAREIIDTDVAELASNTIAVTGIEFRCNVDFLGNRVKRKLEQLKRKLLFKKPLPIEPVICQVVPPIVDMSVSANERNKITISGYDLKKDGDLKMYLVNDSSNEVDYTTEYSASTLYQGIINLGANGIPINQSSKRLELRFGDDVISEVPIIHAFADICETKTITKSVDPFTCRPTKYFISDQKIYDLYDKLNIEAYNVTCGLSWKVVPKVEVFVNLIKYSNYIEAETKMQMSGKVLFQPFFTKSNIRTSGTTISRIYSAPSGFKIQKVLGITSDSIVYSDTDIADDQFTGSKGLVQSFIIKGQQSKDDCETGVKVRLKNLEIELVEIEDCVQERSLIGLLRANKSLPQEGTPLDSIINANPTLKSKVKELDLKRN